MKDLPFENQLFMEIKGDFMWIQEKMQKLSQREVI